MAEELQAAEIFGGAWWDLPKTMFGGCSSPCSSGVSVDMGNFMWPNLDILDAMIKTSEEVQSFDASVRQEDMVTSDKWKPRMSESLVSGSSSQDVALFREFNSSTLLQSLFEPIHEENLVIEHNNEAINDYMSSLLKPSPLDHPQITIIPPAKLDTDISYSTRNDRVRDRSTENEEPVLKRPRIETPSPLPSFKVRKEKLGDRITALQQLVSPFGKTDTASVLHEAIEYIRFVHDRVRLLKVTSSMNQGVSFHHRQGSVRSDGRESSKQDLRSQGLCLVPISSVFPVATAATTDAWTPVFGPFG